MDLSRRKMLGLTLGSIGSLLCNPIKAFSWGSFDGIANTHALIVSEAMARLSGDLAFHVSKFPNSKSIMSFDWVTLDGSGKTSGTGPDVEGASKYSEHYYNPYTGEGGGPDAVAKHFKNLVVNIINNKNGAAASKSAAWAAHFLSDMHVPYHMVGLPASEAFRRQLMNIGNLSIDESGPPLLYSTLAYREKIYSTSEIPDGWGYHQRFDKALHRFTKYNPMNKKYSPGDIDALLGTTDWYDPWYYNGEGNHKTSVLTGSHVAWEIHAHSLWVTGMYFNYLDSLLSQSTYDPKWKNTIIQFDGKAYPLEPVNQGIKRFAKACAKETRDKLEKDWATPGISICRAIRAVMTMFRAAVTTIKIEPIRYERYDSHHYKVTCSIVNTNRSETLQNVKIMLHLKRSNGEVLSKAKQLNRGVRPLKRDVASYKIPVNNNEKIDLICVVTGEYQKTPDLGYNKKSISISVDKASPEPVPEHLTYPEPQVQPPNQPTYSSCPMRNPDPSKRSHKFDTNGDPNDDTYLHCRYFSDGALQSQTPYLNNKKDGLELEYGIGLDKSSHPINYKTNYKGGKKHGIKTIYCWCQTEGQKNSKRTTRYKCDEALYNMDKKINSKGFPAPCY